MIKTEKHIAVVVDTNDPEQRFRIKVKCAGLLGGESAAITDWIQPKLQWGWLAIPDIDEQVEIEVVVGSDTDEVPGQSFLDTPSIRWTGVRYQGPGAYNAMFSDANYGKRRGFVTPAGHVMMFDDTPGKERVNLVWHNQDGNYSMVSLDEDGSILISNKSGSMLYLNAKDKEASLIDEHGNLVSSGATGVKMVDKSGDFIELNAANKLIQVQAGSVYVGGLSGTEPGVLADTLLTIFRAHVHPTGTGPSGPPTEVPPLAFDAIKSAVLQLL